VYVDSNEEPQTISDELQCHSIPEYLKAPARRQSYTHIGSIRTTQSMPRRLSVRVLNNFPYATERSDFQFLFLTKISIILKNFDYLHKFRFFT